MTNLTSPGLFSDVSFTVSSGEIVGLGGIQGNGQREIARALFGMLPATGEVQLEGVRFRLGSPRDAIRAGIVYVPADRRRESVFTPHSIRENIAVPHLRAWSSIGTLNLSLERAVSIQNGFAIPSADSLP